MTTNQALRPSHSAEQCVQKAWPRSSIRPVLALGLAALCGLGSTGDLPCAERSTWLAAQLRSANSKLPVDVRREKYDTMRKSALGFFRGSAHLFWQDFGTSPQLARFGGVAQTRTWLAGDAHPNNFGSFRNARGSLIYDLNDFDESVIADYQLDLWRMGTSLVLLMREQGGFAAVDEVQVLDAFTDRYLQTLATCVGSNLETTVTLTAETAHGKLDDFLRSVANKKSRQRMLDSYTLKDERGQRVLSRQASTDLADVPTAIVDAVRAAMPAYGASLQGGVRYSASHFAVKSVALRLHAGLGSLGSDRYYVLIEGETTSPDDDVILDVKAQVAPSAYRNLSAQAIATTDQAALHNHALRVVTAARSMGNYVDEYLGTMKLAQGSYSVRERSPWKDYLDTDKLRTVEKLSKLAEQWAMLLAYAHARADQDAPGKAVPYDFEQEVTKRTLGKQAEFRALVRDIALANAAQVNEDFQAFLRAGASAP